MRSASKLIQQACCCFGTEAKVTAASTLEPDTEKVDNLARVGNKYEVVTFSVHHDVCFFSCHICQIIRYFLGS